MFTQPEGPYAGGTGTAERGSPLKVEHPRAVGDDPRQARRRAARERANEVRERERLQAVEEAARPIFVVPPNPHRGLEPPAKPTTLEEVHHIAMGFVQQLGFPHLALGFWSGAGRTKRTARVLTNAPREFELIRDDVLARLTRHIGPVVFPDHLRAADPLDEEPSNTRRYLSCEPGFAVAVPGPAGDHMVLFLFGATVPRGETFAQIAGNAWAFLASFYPEVRRVLAPPEPTVTLSKREREVLQYLVEGMNLKRLEGVLGVHHRTLQNTIVRAKRKLGATSRDNLMARAVAQGVVTLMTPSSSILAFEDPSETNLDSAAASLAFDDAPAAP